MGIDKISILKHLLELFEKHGITGMILIDGTLCINRINNGCREMSAACATQDRNFTLRCIQKTNTSNELMGYTITLTDKNEKLLCEEGYSLPQGPHMHEVVNGVKNNTHIPTSINLEDTVKRFLVAIERNT